MGNRMVDGAVRKLFGVLQPSDIGTQFIPGNVFRLFMQDVGKIVKISADVSAVRYKSVVSKTTKGDHLPISIKIFVHNETS